MPRAGGTMPYKTNGSSYCLCTMDRPAHKKLAGKKPGQVNISQKPVQMSKQYVSNAKNNSNMIFIPGKGIK